MGRPLIGITPDVTEHDWQGTARLRAESGLTYASAVARAGGIPVILAPMVECVEGYLDRCDGVVLSGGDDPRMEEFGGVTHARARPMHPRRQAFEVALLRGLDGRAETPALGICLGMQMMALHAGGALDQCLEETLASHERHTKDRVHVVAPVEPSAWMTGAGEVASNHRQAVTGAGRLRVAARAEDGVIEAVDDPSRRFYVGVQWHPERTRDARLGDELIAAFVRACARAR
ncbi:MAG: gamma-glutamyl-gamma-aminobutyrate hydrolase family protein [Phycisphaerales bacterium]